jgi:DNA-binding transcriptional ArsR family regulator
LPSALVSGNLRFVATDQMLEALADPTRRRIFESLRPGELNVVRIAAQVPVSRPAVSQHLRVLLDAGLVRVRAAGTSRYYSIDRAALAELRRWFAGFWTDQLTAFAAEAITTRPPASRPEES